jgi:hypothetical protein
MEYGKLPHDRFIRANLGRCGMGGMVSDPNRLCPAPSLSTLDNFTSLFISTTIFQVFSVVEPSPLADECHEFMP